MKRAGLILAALGALLLVVMLVQLGLHAPGARNLGSRLHTRLFVALLGVAVVLYFAAVAVVLRRDLPRSAVWWIVGLGVAMRVILVPVPPFLSSDMYRYVWDGRVQAAGINPYRYIPADPALAPLRDAAIYPHVNRATYARTIYPPMAERIFAAVARVAPGVLGVKLAVLLSEGAAMAALIALLARAGLSRARVLIYAWNPLPIWAFAGNGHVDAFAVSLLAIALLLRARHRDGVAGAVLAAATLVKFLPIVVAPAFLRGGRFWRPAIAGAAVLLLLYLPYLSAGRHILGFLPGYGSEEGLNDGSGFWLLAGLARFTSLPPFAKEAYFLIAGIALLALAIAVAKGRLGCGGNDTVTLCRDTALLAGGTMVALSPHYPWYFAWLAVPCVVAPIPAVLWLSAAPVALYLNPFNERFLWPAILYLPAILLFLAQLRRRPIVGSMAASKGIS